MIPGCNHSGFRRDASYRAFPRSVGEASCLLKNRESVERPPVQNAQQVPPSPPPGTLVIIHAGARMRTLIPYTGVQRVLKHVPRSFRQAAWKQDRHI